ncbi:mannitol-1-phosphate 5-dehydrogenase [Brevibacillus laterosporus]|uniref:Mannitol-1-phosphate 5-dehydrogenase n=1 Tax=Brevibacillus laterosporus TaxID=1465 RepID=A0A518V7D7_BRELA|nr:mannitol-1-phosphate 5-dehydrogenase [Brevibacillus laterosporus]QDX92879.1 mannitol-1-phosphate 5-dehydrogenase [Brevibacillus laterosporus]TPG71233.1 mannitol-1-phosphate 5-dehydrogenase [Brevibacillus laterosporus]
MRAIHFGAGNIGRGFIGLLLEQAGYEVCFVDVNEALVNEINQRKSYTVQIADEETQEFTVRNVCALHGADEQAVAQAIATADLVTTAVGPQILPYISKSIALGMKERMNQTTEALNIIACENAIAGSTLLKQYVYSHLNDVDQAKADQQFGFPDSAVDRIVPMQKNGDMLVVMVEAYFEWVIDQSQAKGKLPESSDIIYVDNLEPYIERKLYTVNTGHATAAYLGYLKGYIYMEEAIKDPQIRRLTEEALQETGNVLQAKYGFNAKEHATYITKIIHRFENKHLQDEVTRIARSPIRKLGLNDRFISPARQALMYQMEPKALCLGIAAALSFDYNQDVEALELQNSIKQQGLKATIIKYCGLTEESTLIDWIVEKYAEIQK